MIQALNDDDPYMQKSAAESLAYIGDRRAIEPLGKIINDKNVNIRTRLEMMNALDQFNDYQAEEELSKVLKDSKNDQLLRIMSISSLRNIAERNLTLSEDPLNTLFNIYRHDKDNVVKDQAAQLLAYLNEIPPLPEPEYKCPPSYYEISECKKLY